MDGPPFYCPIEPARFPDVAEVTRRAVTWIDEQGFCRTPTERDNCLASNAADFFARFAPAADLTRLVTATCWIYLGFAFDDAYCDAIGVDDVRFAEVAAKFQRALEAPRQTGFGDGHLADYLAAVHDIGHSMRAQVTPVQVQRFAAAHRAWLSGVQWQISNDARGRLPDLDDYLVMRMRGAGGDPTYALIEIANNAEVPGYEMDSPAVRALTEMACLIGALDNDRHSLAKEVHLENTAQNIVTVLMAELNYSFQHAMAAGIALRDQILRRFLDLREHVMRRASHPLHRYLVDLGHGIRGNIDWGLHTLRYTDPAGAGDITGESPGVRDTAEPDPTEPADGRPDPRGLPAIAWWWDDLGKPVII